MEFFIVKDKRIDYDGFVIQSYWVYRNFGIFGDLIVIFCGKCDVKVEEMIDIEDFCQSKEIKSYDMVYYIIEVFDFVNIFFVLMFQKFFIVRLCEVLGEYGVKI